MNCARTGWRFLSVTSNNASSIVARLKACAELKDFDKGSKLHACIWQHEILRENCYIASSLVSMYSRFSALERAQQVLDELPVRDLITWNALIAGYTQQGHAEKALQCFDCMLFEGHTPGSVSFVCALKACGSIGAVTKGEQIHVKVLSLGLLEKSVVLGSTLVNMYAKCGALAKAQQVLNKLPLCNAVTWNALITGYVCQGQDEDALKCFDNMQCQGYSPNAVTFICALKTCGNIGSFARGENIHDEIVSLGLLEKDTALVNSLVDMYVKCGALAKAQEVLNRVPVRDVITWNTVMAGYAQQGCPEEAMKCFDSMQREGHFPDVVTFVCALKACSSIRAAAKGKQIHDRLASLDLVEKDVVVGGALVDMYASCGALKIAQLLLDELPIRNVVAWNALIGEYAEQGHGEEALKCFDTLQCEGHSPDLVTFICALKACGSIGAVDKGKEIHDKIVSLGLLKIDIALSNALLDMYVKCAALARAAKVFEEIPIRNTITWSTLIGGYAQQGLSGEALIWFERMQCKGVIPDLTSFVCVLNSCSNSGLLDHAEAFFSRMSSKYGIEPDVEHYSCMVDLFSRAGEFNKALMMMETMPSIDYHPAWIAFLGACRKWGGVKMGRLAFDRALDLDNSDVAAYVCMSCIYTAAGMQDEADEIEELRIKNNALNLALVMADRPDRPLSASCR